MDRIKPLDWQQPVGSPHRLPRQLRVACAWLLRSASIALDRLAQRLAAADELPSRLSRGQVEFHAESGAPEGALFVDGKFVGWIDGVKRL